MDKSRIPAALQELPRWIVWRWGPPDQRGKRPKRPASPIDGVQKDWRHRPGTLDQALALVQAGQFDGIGFLPTVELDVVLIDLDSCVQGSRMSRLIEWLISEAGTYTESSPSKTGIRLIGLGRVERSINEPGLIEVGQSSNKYFTITGDRLDGFPDDAQPFQGFLDRLDDFRKLLKADRDVRMAPKGDGNNTLYQRTKDLIKQTSLEPELIAEMMVEAAVDQGRRPVSEAEATVKSAIESAITDLETMRAAITYGTGHEWIASTLMEMFEGRFRWVREHERWMMYVEGRWEYCSENEVVAEGMTKLHQLMVERLRQATSQKETNEIIDLIRMVNNRHNVVQGARKVAGTPGYVTKTDEMDAHPWLLNVLNGTLDLRTRALLPHNPDYIISKMAGVPYVEMAEAPRFLRHLERVLPNPRIRRQVQRDMGVALVGETLSEFIDLWIGAGSNGKTTTAQVFQRVMGDYCVQAAPNLLVRKRFEDHPTGLADLAGSRLVFASELEEGQELNEVMVKQITGGDIQKARFIRGNFFSFKPTFTTVLYANNKPIIRGVDKGIWRRVRLIEWSVEIPVEERRPQGEVVDAIMEEGPGVLNWMLDGLDDYLNDPGWLAPEVDAATAAYQSEQDFLADFIQGWCVIQPDQTISIMGLYAAYLEYCQLHSEHPLGKKKFNMAMAARGFRKEMKAIGSRWEWAWFGLGLADRTTETRGIHLNGADLE